MQINHNTQNPHFIYYHFYLYTTTYINNKSLFVLAHNRVYTESSSRGGGSRRRRAEIVCETVPPQVAIPAEDFAAGGAVVRLDVGVGQKMGLQI